MADREFQEIRNAATDLLQQASLAPAREAPSPTSRPKPLNAFNFLRVVGHFFRNFDFESHKVTPYITVRHCLYLYDKQTFGPMLYKGTRERFAGWLEAVSVTPN